MNDIFDNHCGCGRCDACQKKTECKNPCSCTEPVFSVEAMPDDPTTLRFNVNGKSVWYDFEPVVKAGETCTTLTVDTVNRTLNYHGECGDNTIAARELGSILHLADIGDVDADSITDNGILNYRKEGDCGEGCEGIGDGWRSTSPQDVATTSMTYILGADSDGKMISLLPPADTTKQALVGWNGSNKISYITPAQVSAPPVDSDGYAYQLWVDPATGELVYTKVQQN